MRILIVTATYLPTLNGISLSIKPQKDEFTARGHTVTVIAPKHPNQKRESGVVRLSSIPNLAYPDYPIFLPFPYKYSHFKLLDKKYDLVYFHHPFYVGEIAILLAKHFKCPAFFFYHTQYDEYAKILLPKQIPYKPVKKFIVNHIKDLSSKVDHIFVETQTLKQKLDSFGIKKPITVATSGRDSMKLSGITKSDLRKRYNLPIRSRIILCVSRLSKEKNIETLIKMIGRLKINKKHTLVLVGDGPERKMLEKIADSLNLKNIIFLGSIDYDKLPEIYSLADIFAFPSKSETQAIVLIEAMTAGLPLIGFKSSGPTDFIVDKSNGFLCNNIQEFEKSLNTLISDSRARKKMGRRSLLYSKGYSFSLSVDKIEQTFNNVISKFKSSKL